MPTPTPGSPLAGDNPLRRGAVTGIGYYVQFGYWPFGTPGLNGRPGYQIPPVLRLGEPDPRVLPHGLQLLARFDAIDMSYQGGSREAGHGGGAVGADGWYSILGLEFGANYWITRHMRFGVNYLQYILPDAPESGVATSPRDNHFHAPHGNPTGYGELDMRVALVL
jgi:hypothetical protein